MPLKTLELERKEGRRSIEVQMSITLQSVATEGKNPVSK
jgi:hypothetical protein